MQPVRIQMRQIPDRLLFVLIFVLALQAPVAARSGEIDAIPANNRKVVAELSDLLDRTLGGK